MPDFGSSVGLSVAAIRIWAVAFLVVGWIIWGGRKNYVAGTAMVLKKFRINEDPSARAAVEITGRASGLVSWVLTLLKVQPEIEFTVTSTEVTRRTASLSGIQYIYIPLEKITAAVCGYQRSILAFAIGVLFSLGFVYNLLSALFENDRSQVGSDFGMAFMFLLFAGVAFAAYYLSKRIAISVESMHTHGVVFKRSIIENVSVDMPEALRAISVINARILAAQTVKTVSVEPGSTTSRPLPAAVPPRGNGSERCSRCGTPIELGNRFCENCGASVP